jgi:hypothetical protein
VISENQTPSLLVCCRRSGNPERRGCLNLDEYKTRGDRHRALFTGSLLGFGVGLHGEVRRNVCTLYFGGGQAVKTAAAGEITAVGKRGKKSDPRFTQISVLVEKDVYLEVKRRLIGREMDASDLVNSLLLDWLKKSAS